MFVIVVKKNTLIAVARDSCALAIARDSCASEILLLLCFGLSASCYSYCIWWIPIGSEDFFCVLHMSSIVNDNDLL